MDLLLATTLRALMNKKVWNKFKHLVSADLFPNATAAALFGLIEKLHGETVKSINAQSLRTAMEAHVVDPARRAELTLAINYLMEVRRSALKTAEQAIRRYIARGYAEQAVWYYQLHCNDVAFDFAVPAELMGRAHGIVQMADEPVVAARRVGLPGDSDMVRVAVGLGYSAELDAALAGGVGCGELGVLLAPPARGKTSYLIAAATNAVRAGHTVLYFTMEIRQHKVFTRYFQTLSSLTYTEMVQARDLLECLRQNVAGEFHCADYTKAQLTPSRVHAEIEKMQGAGIPVSYVVIDYAELMDPTSGFGRGGVNSRTLGDMVKELRRVAAFYDIPILTAWQVNRGGNDKHVFSESDISECWEVVKHADIILGLNQGPLELTYNTLRMKVLKQRESPARPLLYLYSDMTRNIIRQLDNTEVANIEHTEGQAGTAMESRSRSGAHLHRPGLDAGQRTGSSGVCQERGQAAADPASDLEDGTLVPGDDSGLDQRP